MSAIRILGRASLVPLMFLGTWFVPRADAEFKEEHRHIHHAIHELREAKVELQEAKHDFGGHREQALKAVEAALFQLKECLVGAKDPFDSVKVDKDIYKKHENHPHIHEAIHELKDARTQLKEAKHDFGGHREQAIKDIDYAIEQLEICLKHVK